MTTFTAPLKVKREVDGVITTVADIDVSGANFREPMTVGLATGDNTTATNDPVVRAKIVRVSAARLTVTAALPGTEADPVHIHECRMFVVDGFSTLSQGYRLRVVNGSGDAIAVANGSFLAGTANVQLTNNVGAEVAGGKIVFNVLASVEASSANIVSGLGVFSLQYSDKIER